MTLIEQPIFIVAVLVATYIDGDDSLAQGERVALRRHRRLGLLHQPGPGEARVRDPYSAEVDAR